MSKPAERGDLQQPVEALIGALKHFDEVLGVATVLVEGGGRRVDGIEAAAMLSAATDEIYLRTATLNDLVCRRFGRTKPVGVGVTVTSMPIIGSAHQTLLLTALGYLQRGGLAFPNEVWNAAQERRPGANHWRWNQGDVIDAATLDKVVRVERTLCLWRQPEAPAPSAAAESETEVIAQLKIVTPSLDKTNGTWVLSKDAAKQERIKVVSLAEYRKQGIRDDVQSIGRDKYGRVWRREGSSNNHPWYLVSTLKKK